MECKRNIFRRDIDRFRERNKKKYKIDILALQKTKRKINFVLELEEYIFLNNGNDQRCFETGFY